MPLHDGSRYRHAVLERVSPRATLPLPLEDDLSRRLRVPGSGPRQCRERRQERRNGCTKAEEEWKRFDPRRSGGKTPEGRTTDWKQEV